MANYYLKLVIICKKICFLVRTDQ